MRHAFVTGATGYVGRLLVDGLLREGWRVDALVRPDSDLSRLPEAPGRLICHVHDGSTEALVRIVGEARPEVIFHVASQVSAGHRPADIEPMIRANVLLGTQLLEACVAAGTQVFVNTGTFWQHYDGAAYSPVCLYAATKQAFEDILLAYAETVPMKAATLVLFDVYGPDDHRRKLFKLLAEAESTGKTLAMSAGAQQMDLTYVDDVVRAYTATLAWLEASPDRAIYRRFAVSSGTHVPLRQVVATYEDVTRTRIPIEWGARPYRAREVMTPWIGEVVPGWKAEVGLAEGIRRMLRLGPETDDHAPQAFSETGSKKRSLP